MGAAPGVRARRFLDCRRLSGACRCQCLRRPDRQPDFVERVQDVLRETRMPPQLLDLELTETALMQDIELIAERMLRLRVIGITISVDDFGAGYSSLSRLQQLPLDSIKIDISFVREIHSSV